MLAGTLTINGANFIDNGAANSQYSNTTSAVRVLLTSTTPAGSFTCTSVTFTSASVIS